MTCCCNCSETTYNVFGWIFQVATWVFFICSFASKFQQPAFFVPAFLFYFIYYIIEFCSPTASYLCNKSTAMGMYEKMLQYFRTPPVIKWYCECYHFEDVPHKRTNSRGETEVYYTREKVVTHTDSATMSYHFSRDVSGPFVLECDPNAIRNKFFIKLQLFQNIDFADSLTVSEYLRQKTAFINMNRILDTHFDFSENRYIPGVVEYNLVKITEEEPACVNFGLFFLLTVLTFVEFYKIYMNYFSLSQEFTIKKVISTSYDLNFGEFLTKYQPVIPVLNLIKIQYTFQPSDYNYSNESYPLPSKEEVEKDDNKKKMNKYIIQENKEPENKKQDANFVEVNQKNENTSGYNMPPPSVRDYDKSGERFSGEKANYLSVKVKNEKK